MEQLAGPPAPPAASALDPVVSVLFQAVLDALATGEVDTARLEDSLPAALNAQLHAWRDSSEDLRHVPDGALAGCLIGYVQLHGVIAVALAERLRPQLGDVLALFDAQMNHISASLHHPPPLWDAASTVGGSE
ncbi:MAG: hypothetical protein ACRDVP_10460 [Acidimicrobiales bacterium]